MLNHGLNHELCPSLFKLIPCSKSEYLDVLNQDRMFYTHICAKKKFCLKKRNHTYLGHVTNHNRILSIQTIAITYLHLSISISYLYFYLPLSDFHKSNEHCWSFWSIYLGVVMGKFSKHMPT